LSGFSGFGSSLQSINPLCRGEDTSVRAGALLTRRSGVIRKVIEWLRRAWNRFVNPDLSTIRDDPVSRATLGFVRSPYTHMSMYMHGRTTGGLVIPFLFGDGYHDAKEIQEVLRESIRLHDVKLREREQRHRDRQTQEQ